MGRAHAHYFTALAEADDLREHDNRHVEWNARMHRDIENVRAALSWCIVQVETGESEAMDLVLRLIKRVCEVGYRGGAREQRDVLLNTLRRLPATVYPEARAQALLNSGVLAERAGFIAQSNELYEEALTLAQATGNTPVVVWSLVHLGMARTDPDATRCGPGGGFRPSA